MQNYKYSLNIGIIMTNKQICDECKKIIKDDHQHFLINWDDQRVPACCSCFDHLVGCEANIPIQWCTYG